MNGRQKLGVALVAFGAAVWSGCGGGGYVSTGYVTPGPFYADPFYDPVFPGPDIYVFGGPSYPHHHFDHAFSRRGFESRRGFHDFGHMGRPPGAVHGGGRGGFPSGPRGGGGRHH